MYSTYNSFRMRWTPGGLVREPTGANAAQWGISQDNSGKVWFQGGASGMPGYFQFPIHYGNFDVPDRFEPDLNITWGAPILIGDIQAGPAGHAPPRRIADPRHRVGGQRDLSRRSAAEGSRRRLPVRRSRRADRPPDEAGQERGAHTAAQRLSALGVHSIARPALPAGGCRRRARRNDLHRRHVSRHHRGGALGQGRHLPPAEDRPVPDGQDRRLRPDLAADLRRHRARPHAAAHAAADARAARGSLVPPERMVARYRATAARPEAGQIRRSRASPHRPDFHQSAGPGARAVDAGGTRCARRGAGPTGHGRCGSADADPGDPRQRDALQGRRPLVRGGLPGDDQGCRHGRRHPGDVDPQPVQAG